MVKLPYVGPRFDLHLYTKYHWSFSHIKKIINTVNIAVMTIYYFLFSYRSGKKKSCNNLSQDIIYIFNKTYCVTSSHHATISMVTRSTQYINQQITHTHRAWCEQSVGCTAACSSERSWLAGTGVSAPWWQNINSQQKATMSTIWRRSKVIN